MCGNDKNRLAMVQKAIVIAGILALLGSIHGATLRDGHEWGDDFVLPQSKPEFAFVRVSGNTLAEEHS